MICRETPIKILCNLLRLTFQRGDCLYTSESDVSRRQILTYKDDPRIKIVKICQMAVDP